MSSWNEPRIFQRKIYGVSLKSASSKDNYLYISYGFMIMALDTSKILLA